MKTSFEDEESDWDEGEEEESGEDLGFEDKEL